MPYAYDNCTATLVANRPEAAERAACWLTAFGTDFAVSHSKLKGEWRFTAPKPVIHECARVNGRDFVPFRKHTRLE